MERLTILPEVVTLTSLQEITAQALCSDPPHFIPKQTVTARAYLLLEMIATLADPMVMWAQITG